MIEFYHIIGFLSSAKRKEEIVMGMKEEFIGNVVAYMSDLSNAQVDDLRKCLTKLLCKYDMKKVEFTGDDICYLDKFEADLLVEGKSEKTIKQYISHSKNFLDYIGKSFFDVTKDDIVSYLHEKIESGVTKTSVDNTRKYIKQYFNWLVDNDILLKNPFSKIKPIKRNPIKKEIITSMEMEEIRDACKSKKEIAIIDFLESTGVRVSELCDLKMKDIDFVNGICKVKSSKTNSYRYVCLTPKALKHIKDYNTGHEYVFYSSKNKNMSANSIQKLLHKIVSRTCISKNVTVHSFRKTLASRLSMNGVSPNVISELLGHSFLTSQKYYISISQNEIRKQYDMAMR